MASACIGPGKSDRAVAQITEFVGEHQVGPGDQLDFADESRNCSCGWHTRLHCSGPAAPDLSGKPAEGAGTPPFSEVNCSRAPFCGYYLGGMVEACLSTTTARPRSKNTNSVWGWNAD